MARKRWTQLTEDEQRAFWQKSLKEAPGVIPSKRWEALREDELLAEKHGNDTDAMTDELVNYALHGAGNAKFGPFSQK